VSQDPQELLGAKEFAIRAGLKPSTFRAYLARGQADIPPPDFVTGAGKGKVPGWREATADAWIAKRPPRAPSETQTTSIYKVAYKDPGNRLADVKNIPNGALVRIVDVEDHAKRMERGTKRVEVVDVATGSKW